MKTKDTFKVMGLFLLIIWLIYGVFIKDNTEDKGYTSLPPLSSTAEAEVISPTTETVKTNKYTDAEMAKYSDSFRKVIEQQIEEKTMSKKQSIQRIDYSDDMLTAELVTDGNSLLGPDLIRSSVYLDSTNIFKSIYGKGKAFPDVTLKWHAVFRDAKGHSTLEPIITIELSEENARTFNWNDFLFIRLPEAVDTYTEYAIFKN
ncbi:hypothetical protein [Paenibacillus polymyxa]|uniref:Uncharacterized protein n=1 Tax=Paenibacillus polymyxa TaxID=1406 RepID=A0AAP4E936_PAEPO|nr:hypothetical protein [Paenibacillus polymyxa]MDH2330515.1 hypothetical protein [Paenibacillus polymyxa]